MAGDGVRVATAFIELNVDDSSVTDTVKGALDNAGTYAKDAGRKIGDNISSGAKSAMQDLTRSIGDAGKRGAKQLSTELIEGVRKGAKEASAGFQREFNDMVQRSASGVGKKLSDAISKSGASTALQDIASQMGPVVDTVNGVSNALKGIREHNAGAALQGISDALGKMGQTGAADTLKQIADKAGEAQNKASQLKTDIEGTTTGLLTLTNNSGKIAGGLTAISNAAGPLAATFAALSTINPAAINALTSIGDQLQGKKPFNLKDWFNGLIPGTTYLDRPLQDIFGPSPLKTGKAPTTPSSGFTPGDFLPGGSSQRNFYKDWYGGASTDGTNGLLQPDSTGALLGAAAPSGMTSRAIAPTGAYNGPDANGGFPQWVNDLGSRFSLTPSTYSGHQTTNRAEAGFAPNPQNFNRGIDWGGPGVPPERMQQFADFAQAHPELFEQVIWNNPKTGQTVTIAGGRLVSPSYYADDLGGHTDHVHTRFSKGFSLNSIPSFDKGTDGPLDEDTLAQLHKGEIVVPKDQVDAMQHAGSGAAPGPGDTPDDALARTMGYVPAAAEGNAGGVAGTSSLAGLFDLGNQAVGGLIDTGASLAQMAVQAGMAAGTFGGSAAAGPAAGAAAGYGIQLAATQGKRLASYGFQMGAIAADALVEQLFPFGAPRWIGYDYTQFVPQLNISEIGTTTAEKAMQSQLQAQGAEGPPTGLDAAGMMSQLPGGPVNASALPGSQPGGPPTPQFGSDMPTQTPTTPPGTGPGGDAPSLGPPAGPRVMGPPSPSAPSQVPMPMDFIPRPNTTVNPSLPQNPMLPIPTMESLLFDDGGPWPSGTWGYNGTGRDEFVLSPAHLEAMATKPASKEYMGRGGDTYVVNGQSPDEIARAIASKQRLRGLQHTGRPMSL